MRVVAAFLVNTLCNFAIGLLVAKFLGPEEFGRFALALAFGVVLQTSLFDWLRFVAMRFYSLRSRIEEPALRATTDLTLAIISMVVCAAAIFITAIGWVFSWRTAILGLAAALAIANGLFDYQCALVRGRFDDALYGRLILTKNLLALVVTAGGAYLFAAWEIAAIGVCVSMVGSILLARGSLRDSDAMRDLARRDLALKYLRYAAPIVAASLLYQLIPLTNRALVARWDGFSETGQFSLAFDIGTRIIGAIGTALDVLLFQIAVRAEERHGADEGRDQIARNMALVFAVLLPTCAGVWLTLPSIEQLVVPMQYRGPFEFYFSLLMGAFFALGMINFAVNPVFQIAKRTAPLIVAACIALVADALLIYALPRTATYLAIAQSGAMLAGLTAQLIFAGFSGARWPRLRDLALSSLAVACMIAALLPMRRWEPGLLTLSIEVLVGLTIYGAFVAIFNIAGLRGSTMDYYTTIRAKIH